jgi:hypothetical protein
MHIFWLSNQTTSKVLITLCSQVSKRSLLYEVCFALLSSLQLPFLHSKRQAQFTGAHPPPPRPRSLPSAAHSESSSAVSKSACRPPKSCENLGRGIAVEPPTRRLGTPYNVALMRRTQVTNGSVTLFHKNEVFFFGCCVVLVEHDADVKPIELLLRVVAQLVRGRTNSLRAFSRFNV